MGLGHSHYPIPWTALKYDMKLNGYVTGITEKQLKDAPAQRREDQQTGMRLDPLGPPPNAGMGSRIGLPASTKCYRSAIYFL